MSTLCTDGKIMRGLYEPKHFGEATNAEGTEWGQGFAPDSEDTGDKVRLQTKKYDPNSMIYTVGSHQQETNLTGSGVYGWKDGSEVHTRIKPSKPSPVHTIIRAELSAMLFALDYWCEQEDLVMATDSACAMQTVREHLQGPESHRYHKLFQAICDKILLHAQERQHTSLVKVKSHIGIRGNELADDLAVKATKEWDTDLSEHHTEPFNDMVWVTKLLYAKNGKVNVTPYLADLQDSLRKAIHNKQHLGQANQGTIYFQACKGNAQHICPDISNGYWEE